MAAMRVWGMFFSPCGNVEAYIRAMADAAAQRLGAQAEYIDFTRPRARKRSYTFGPGDMVFVGTPVYAGRVPNKIMPFIKESITGTGTAAVPVVCFGGRSFDNALAELSLLLRQNGFSIAGASAVVGQHSFTDKLAAGRPTGSDLAQAADFAVRAAEKLPAMGEGLVRDAIPGDPDAPYYTPLGTDGQPANFLRSTPDVDFALCNHCGTCAAVCPMGSIDRDDPGKMTGICIKCQACVRKCRRHARSFSDTAFLSHVAMLERDYTRPADPVYIL